METNSPAVESLRVQAWAASNAGNGEYAAKLFNQILKDHPDSEAARDAQLYFAGAPQHASREPVTPIQRVTVVDIDISFGQLVSLFVKGTFALLFVWFFFAAIGFVAFVVVGGLANRSGY